MTFTYKGSEALEMLKTHFPKTWENEVNEGVIFLKGLARLYNQSPIDSYQKYLKTCGSHEKAVSTLASLHVLMLQEKIGNEIQELQKTQLQYGDQTTALENSNITNEIDKKILRQHYRTKQDELQQRIDKLFASYLVVGAEEIVYQARLFEN